MLAENGEGSDAPRNGVHPMQLNGSSFGEGPTLTVMIPLGGLGTRFQREGYTRPKPFVSVMGRPMILWVLDSLNVRADDSLVIVYNPAFLSKKYWPIVTAAYPRIRFVELQGPTRGAAETVRATALGPALRVGPHALTTTALLRAPPMQVMIGLQGLPSDLRAQPVMLVDGDAFYDQDIVSMYRNVAAKANGVFYFEDTQPNPIYSYIVFEPSSRRISQVKEKVKISDAANSGCYCFMSGDELVKQCLALLDAGATQLSQDKVGEFYTSGVIAAMIEEGHAFEAIQIDPARFHVLGTPAQLVAFCCARTDQRSLRICFDLDNTLVTSPRVPGDYSTCEPIDENVAVCRALHERGHRIILVSSRRMLHHGGNVGACVADIGQVTLDTLRRYKIPYHELDFGKPHAHFYVDDDSVSAFSDLHKEIGLYPNAPRATPDGNAGASDEPMPRRLPQEAAAAAARAPLVLPVLLAAAVGVAAGVLIGARYPGALVRLGRLRLR